MPDLPECSHSPLFRHRSINGAALTTGHKRYCDLINPEHPDYNPAIAAQYVSMSIELMKPRKEEPKGHAIPDPDDSAPGTQVPRTLRERFDQDFAVVTAADVAR